ncbi:hypothetical protein [Salinarimonas chemoclinalis]|uniref:hypothetical protein n=1 Tax=Salinarimonas chemoclinalis TaxID=3241599 RepID=UPI0035576FB3
MVSILRALEIPDDLLNTVGVDGVYEHYYDELGQDPRRRVAFEKARQMFHRASDDGVEARIAPLNWESFAHENRKKCTNLIKELVEARISDFHYLPNSYPKEVCAGYVVLLREARHLPRQIGARIHDGITPDEYKRLVSENNRMEDYLEICEEQLACSIGIIDSPYIELIMQRFSALFSRVGVTDLPHNTISLIVGALKLEEGSK